MQSLSWCAYPDRLVCLIYRRRTRSSKSDLCAYSYISFCVGGGHFHWLRVGVTGMPYTSPLSQLQRSVLATLHPLQWLDKGGVYSFASLDLVSSQSWWKRHSKNTMRSNRSERRHWFKEFYLLSWFKKFQNEPPKISEGQYLCPINEPYQGASLMPLLGLGKLRQTSGPAPLGSPFAALQIIGALTSEVWLREQH